MPRRKNRAAADTAAPQEQAGLDYMAATVKRWPQAYFNKALAFFIFAFGINGSVNYGLSSIWSALQNISAAFSLSVGVSDHSVHGRGINVGVGITVFGFGFNARVNVLTYTSLAQANITVHTPILGLGVGFNILDALGYSNKRACDRRDLAAKIIAEHEAKVAAERAQQRRFKKLYGGVLALGADMTKAVDNPQRLPTPLVLKSMPVRAAAAKTAKRSARKR